MPYTVNTSGYCNRLSKYLGCRETVIVHARTHAEDFQEDTEMFCIKDNPVLENNTLLSILIHLYL